MGFCFPGGLYPGGKETSEDPSILSPGSGFSLTLGVKTGRALSKGQGRNTGAISCRGGGLLLDCQSASVSLNKMVGRIKRD